MNGTEIVSICGAPAGSYAVIIWPDNHAFVLPVVGHVVLKTETGHTYITSMVSDSGGHPLDVLGAPVLLDTFQDAEWKTFAPGENALSWAARWQEATGRKIEQWDVSVWWPIQSPLFAAANETEWTEDFVPPDMSN